MTPRRTWMMFWGGFRGSLHVDNHLFIRVGCTVHGSLTARLDDTCQHEL
jgi:hypothetical protein